MLLTKKQRKKSPENNTPPPTEGRVIKNPAINRYAYLMERQLAIRGYSLPALADDWTCDAAGCGCRSITAKSATLCTHCLSYCSFFDLLSIGGLVGLSRE